MSSNNENTLKKERKTYERDVESSMKARRVESPPLKTAGPTLVIVASTLSSRLPEAARKKWTM